MSYLKGTTIVFKTGSLTDEQADKIWKRLSPSTIKSLIKGRPYASVIRGKLWVIIENKGKKIVIYCDEMEAV